MDTADLQTKLTQLTQLLPSQRECLDRLLFQLAFNQHKSIRIVGAEGTGKSVLALAMAELFSDRFNVALLDNKTKESDVTTHLMKQWFNLTASPDTPLTEQLNAAASSLPLLLIVDDADSFSDALLQKLHEQDCLLFCFARDDGQSDDLTLVLNTLTPEDAAQLLHHQQLNEVDIAQRLAYANGNIHLLLQALPTAVAAGTEEDNTSVVRRYKPILVATAGVLLLAVLWWVMSGADNAQTPAPVVNTTQPDPIYSPVADKPVAETVVLDTEQYNATAEQSQHTAPVLQQPEVDEPDLATPELAASDEYPAADEQQPVARLSEQTTEHQYDEIQLLAMDNQAFAVQLAVLSSDAAYQRFKLAYPELPVLAYMRSWQGQKQLVLLLADYVDKAAAKATIAALPPALTATGPFIKALQAVQTEINVRQSITSAAAIE